MTTMSNKSPVFPMPDPQHYSDYGFDPQINYFQVLEEARKHKKKENSIYTSSIHFKLEKPISEDVPKKKIKRWSWKNALFFLKLKWISIENDNDVHEARARACSFSGPVYITESRSGSSTPSRTTSRQSSSPLAGTLTPVRKGDAGIPYLSLRELNMEDRQQQCVSTSAMPIYLVT